tara:strand:+ start:3236 stop:3736 length:501 start_codon:yes stop_codon:yes gene_type:complete
MIAVFKTGGKQYCVQTGQILKIEKIEGKKGESHIFNKILFVNENSNSVIGNPLIKGASIKAKIIDQIRGKKIIVYKKRRRKNYHSTRGHRQSLTVLQIESINNKGNNEVAKLSSKKTKNLETQTKPLQSTKVKQIKTKKKKSAIEKKLSTKKKVKKTIVKKTIKSK